MANTLITITVALEMEPRASWAKTLRNRAELINLLQRVESGAVRGRVLAGMESIDGGARNNMHARGTVAVAAAISDADTLTVGGQAFTWRTAPSAANEVLIGSSNQESLNNLLEVFNQSPKSGFIFARMSPDDSNLLEFTYVGSPAVGDTVTLAQTGAWATLSGATFSRVGTSAEVIGPGRQLGG